MLCLGLSLVLTTLMVFCALHTFFHYHTFWCFHHYYRNRKIFTAICICLCFILLFYYDCCNVFSGFTDCQFERDLNKDNALGMGGEMAEAFRTLVRKLWKGRVDSVSPGHIKVSLVCGEFSC